MLTTDQARLISAVHPRQVLGVHSVAETLQWDDVRCRRVAAEIPSLIEVEIWPFDLPMLRLTKKGLELAATLSTTESPDPAEDRAQS